VFRTQSMKGWSVESRVEFWTAVSLIGGGGGGELIANVAFLGESNPLGANCLKKKSSSKGAELPLWGGVEIFSCVLGEFAYENDGEKGAEQR